MIGRVASRYLNITSLLTVLIILLASPSWAMERYVNVVQDRQGNAIPGTQISVYLPGTTVLADIFSDNGNTPKLNPFTNNSNGSYDFFAANGLYDLHFQRSGTDFSTSNEIYRSVSLFDQNDSDIVGGAASWPNNVTSAAATSEDLPLKVRGIGGQTNSGWNIYMHSNGTPTIKCVIAGVEGDCNVQTVIDSGNYWAIYDSSNSLILKIEPGAGALGNIYTFGAGYHPVKSIWFGAGALYGDGTNCPADPTAVTINSGPKLPTFICADNNGSRLNGFVKMPDSYDGSAITLTQVFIQTAADTNALNGDSAAQCRGNGVAPNSTWGTEVPLNKANVSGSNKNDFITSGAITPNGTCTGAPMLYWYWDMDALGTTTAAATLNILGFMMEYGVTSWSD